METVVTIFLVVYVLSFIGFVSYNLSDVVKKKIKHFKVVYVKTHSILLSLKSLIKFTAVNSKSRFKTSNKLFSDPSYSFMPGNAYHRHKY